MKQRRIPVALVLVLLSGLWLTACAKEKDHDDDEGSSALIAAPSSTTTNPTPVTSTPTTPTAPTTPTTPTTPSTSAAVAYTQDIRPIMVAACTRCHSNFATYSGIKTMVTAGSASSRLVTKTQSSGSMYTYLPADKATNAALIRTWVINGAPENR
jgi:uncharacterized membrane protein